MEVSCTIASRIVDRQHRPPGTVGPPPSRTWRGLRALRIVGEMARQRSRAGGSDRGFLRSSGGRRYRAPVLCPNDAIRRAPPGPRPPTGKRGNRFRICLSDSSRRGAGFRPRDGSLRDAATRVAARSSLDSLRRRGSRKRRCSGVTSFVTSDVTGRSGMPPAFR